MIFVNKCKYEKELILGIFRSGGPSMSLIIPDISYLGELWTSADLIHSTTLCYDTQKPSRPFIYPWIRRITIFTKCVKRCWLTDRALPGKPRPNRWGFSDWVCIVLQCVEDWLWIYGKGKGKNFWVGSHTWSYFRCWREKNIWIMGIQWILFTGTR